MPEHRHPGALPPHCQGIAASISKICYDGAQGDDKLPGRLYCYGSAYVQT